MRLQANIAIDIADVIIFVTDVRQGVTAADEEIALMLKKSIKLIVFKNFNQIYMNFTI